jgi:hypothetical protein
MSWICPGCTHECDTEKRCPECYYRRPDLGDAVELPDPKSVQLLLDAKPHLRLGRIMNREDALSDALLDVAMGAQTKWTVSELAVIMAQLDGSSDRLDDWLAIRT